jgi:acetyl esterase
MLDLELARFLEAGRASGAPDLCELPPNPARGLYRQLTSAGDRPPAPVAVDARLIDGPAGSLPIRIYRPSVPSQGIVLYLHGGGFVVGDLDCYQGICSNLAAGTGCTVVAVDYRLAPEAPFPAGVEDCYAALEWVAAHAAELGGAGQRLAVVGDSAGGNLAAVLALLARDRHGPALAFQALIYPVVSAKPGLFPSYEAYGQGYVLTRATMDYFNRLYFGDAAKAPDFRGAPLLATNFQDLPRALIQVAGYDALHDEGVFYAEKLMSAGVPVSLVEYPGLSHGYLNMTGACGTAALAFEQLCSALRAALR